MNKVRLERDGDIGVVVIDNPPVNAGSAAVRQGLLDCIAAVDADHNLRAGVFIGFGKTFISGSDLKEFDLPLDPPQLPQVIEAIERSPMPWVAALHGAALGGGFELALGCDMRVALAGTMVGLPECGLGMIPGAGGIQRLTRLIGKAGAIELVTSSRRIEASEAAALGIIDAILTGDLRSAAVALAQELPPKRRLVEKPVPPEHENEIFAAEEIAVAAGRGRPHILSAIRHIEAVGNLPFDEGLLAEREDFQKLRIAPEARAYRNIFFAERAAGRVDAQIKPSIPSRIGLVGSGRKACAIALAAILAGRIVRIVDFDGKGREAVEGYLEEALRAAVDDGSLTSNSAREALERFSVKNEISSLSECDAVIESTNGDLASKRLIITRIGLLLKADALIASSTGNDSKAVLASVGCDEKLIGLHFINPSDLGGVVEVIRTDATSMRALAQGVSLVRALGYKTVIVRNAPGLIGNRIHAAYRIACERMVVEGMSALDVNDALVAFGFARGPLDTADDLKSRRHEGKKEQLPTLREIQRRALAAMVREADLVLKEGVAEKPGDIDVVMVNAFGFPRWLGGPLYWATSDAAAEITEAESLTA